MGDRDAHRAIVVDPVALSFLSVVIHRPSATSWSLALGPPAASSPGGWPRRPAPGSSSSKPGRISATPFPPSCRMGPSASAAGDVVDALGRTHGISGLNVVDASVIPD
jgi:choline dehydrogenase-like flavoprotein